MPNVHDHPRQGLMPDGDYTEGDLDYKEDQVLIIFDEASGIDDGVWEALATTEPEARHICPECNGQGLDAIHCPVCEGAGWVTPPSDLQKAEAEKRLKALAATEPEKG